MVSKSKKKGEKRKAADDEKASLLSNDVKMSADTYDYKRKKKHKAQTTFSFTDDAAADDDGGGGGGGRKKEQQSTKKYVKVDGKARVWSKKEEVKKVAFTREERKELKRARKELRPHHEIVAAANSVWKLSLRDLPKAERAVKVDEVLAMCGGKIAELAVKHDTSRVLQQLIKYATPAQSGAVHVQLSGHYVKLIVNSYALFIVLKLLQYGSDDVKAAIGKELTGGGLLRKLALHSDAARVLDFLYASSTPARKQQFLLSFYGDEFALLHDERDGGSGLSSLAAVLDGVSATKKTAVLAQLEITINRIVKKEMFVFRYAHSLCWQFLQNCGREQEQELMATLAKSTMALHGSSDGVNVLCHCLTYGGNKERKTIVKALKGSVAELAAHPHAYMLVIKALDVVDDTVLLEKNITAELMSPAALADLPHSATAAKVYLHLLAPRSPSYFSPAELTTVSVLSCLCFLLGLNHVCVFFCQLCLVFAITMRSPSYFSPAELTTVSAMALASGNHYYLLASLHHLAHSFFLLSLLISPRCTRHARRRGHV
jgi:pumilio family protein 6